MVDVRLQPIADIAECSHGLLARPEIQQVKTMTFGIYEASVPVFRNSLANMREWLGKAAQELDEATLMEARLAPDMKRYPPNIRWRRTPRRMRSRASRARSRHRCPTPSKASPSFGNGATG